MHFPGLWLQTVAAAHPGLRKSHLLEAVWIWRHELPLYLSVPLLDHTPIGLHRENKACANRVTRTVKIGWMETVAPWFWKWSQIQERKSNVLKVQFVVFETDVDLASILKFSKQNFVCQDGLDFLLNGSCHRTCSEHRIVSFLCQPGSCRV